VVDERKETLMELKPNQERDSGFFFVYETRTNGEDGGFGLKPERKRKSMEGLLCLLGDWGRRGGNKLRKGAAAASLGFGSAPFIFKCFFYRVSGNGLLLGFFFLF
jgi:hypothetical protein